MPPDENTTSNSVGEDVAAAFDQVEGTTDDSQVHEPAPARSEAPAQAPAAREATPEPARQAPTPAADPGATQAQAPPALKPPVSWGAEAREQWKQIPRPIQEAVLRREHDIGRLESGSRKAREFIENFADTVRPYEALLRAEGTDVMTTVNNLLQTYHYLKTGTPHSRAVTFAKLCQQFDVDVGLLDSALVAARHGQPMQQATQQPQQFHDPRVDQMLARMQQQEQYEQQALVSDVADEIAAFEQDHEFLPDVREDMADLLEMAARRGQAMSLQQAYDKACKGHDSVSKIVTQRELSRAASTLAGAAHRARQASLSVNGAPTVPDGAVASDGSRRGDIEAAISQLSGR